MRQLCSKLRPPLPVAWELYRTSQLSLLLLVLMLSYRSYGYNVYMLLPLYFQHNASKAPSRFKHYSGKYRKIRNKTSFRPKLPVRGLILKNNCSTDLFSNLNTHKTTKLQNKWSTAPVIASIVICILVFIFFFFVCGLMAFHTFLITNGRSTYEQFSNRYQHQTPFDYGIQKNWIKTFCDGFQLFLLVLRNDASFLGFRPDILTL